MTKVRGADRTITDVREEELSYENTSGERKERKKEKRNVGEHREEDTNDDEEEGRGAKERERWKQRNVDKTGGEKKVERRRRGG